jgi:hypothetical protein
MRKLCFGLLWVCLAIPRLFAQETTFNLERIQQATVLVIQAEGDDLTTRCVGSGTIVRPDGIILTNAHNTVESAICPGETLIIALTTDVNEPPIPKYRAEIVQLDAGLDLALLRITQEFDGRAIDPTTFPILPFVDLAEDNTIALDDTLTFVGYTSLANDPVQAIRGAVRGFLAEPSGGEQSWIKTTTVTPVSGIMTGGGIYNALGQLIGIPTSAPLSLSSLDETCILLEDTNDDGFVNNNDACIPIGDSISVSRPVAFARPLIRSATLGLEVEILTAPRFQSIPLDRPQITRVFSSPSVVDNIPSTVVAQLPAGTTSQYLFFDYANMTDETVYEVRVSVDGIPNPTFSLPSVRWSGGERGLWYLGSSGQPYPNGVYEYRIFVDGVALATYTLTIGGAVLTNPAFSNIVFGLLDPAGNLTGNGYVLPSGTTAIARFIYTNMQPELTWTAIWYYNNTELTRVTDTWGLPKGASGSDSISLQPQGGLPIGTYRIELYINSVLSSTGDFVIAGNQEGVLPSVFSNISFIRAQANQAPTGEPATTFPDGANTLYARFDWQQLSPGTRWRLQWLVDETVFYQVVAPWSSPESGSQFTLRLTSPNGVPDGSYTLRLYVNDVLLQTSTVSVGIGQLAIDRLAQASGVQLRGRIIDADTQQGIAGATFILISDAFSIEDFTWSQEQIYALATTDREGFFQIDRPLQLESPYSVLVVVSGYLPLSADGFTVTAEDGNPIDMLIPLTRD